MAWTIYTGVKGSCPDPRTGSKEIDASAGEDSKVIAHSLYETRRRRTYRRAFRCVVVFSPHRRMHGLFLLTSWRPLKSLVWVSMRWSRPWGGVLQKRINRSRCRWRRFVWTKATTHILIRVRIGATWRIRSIDLRSDGDAGCRYVTVAIPNGAFFYRDAAHFGKLTCCYCAVPEPFARVKYGKIK